MFTKRLKTCENHCFLELRRPVGSSYLHRKGSWHLILRLWRRHFEGLELPEAPGGDQESHKKLSKRPQVTIYRPCRRFRASRRGTIPLGFRLSRVRPAPRTRSRSRFFISLSMIRHDLNADAPSSPEGRRITNCYWY